MTTSAYISIYLAIYIYMFMLHKCKLNINVHFNGFLESIVLLIGMFQ